jgi:hypothetical protein
MTFVGRDTLSTGVMPAEVGSQDTSKQERALRCQRNALILGLVPRIQFSAGSGASGWMDVRDKPGHDKVEEELIQMRSQPIRLDSKLCTRVVVRVYIANLRVPLDAYIRHLFAYAKADCFVWSFALRVKMQVK